MRFLLIVAIVLTAGFSQSVPAAGLERLKYNNPGLKVDLGVGLWAWPLPMDWDNDGDLDMVVACPDKPYNGVYFFENPGNGKGKKFPVFKAAKRVGKAGHNMQVSHVDGEARVLRDGYELIDFRKNGFGKTKKLVPNTKLLEGKTRARMWRYVDYDGDGDQDIVAGIGYWGDLEWDHAYDAQGVWQNGPLHGYIYLIRNQGTDAKPEFDLEFWPKEQLKTVGGSPIDVYGWPSPNFADFDGDGDLDLLCGEFLDGFTYFENVGSRTNPKYANGRKMKNAYGDPLVMDLQMITPTAIDWDGDGDQDLVVGDEDGRVALIEHTGRVNGGVPQFLPPVYFEQEASTLKYGALATPFCVDWDGDGDEDIISGNTAGYVGFFENLGGGENPKWARVVNLKAGDRTLRIMAGPNGSIQSPCEAKWGYTTLSVADWDHDGLHDLIINSIWGEILWYRNVGTKGKPKLAAAEAVELDARMPKPKWFWWDGGEKQLVTQWRTTPMAIDFTKDGLMDLVLLDSEGYLCLYERKRKDGQVLLGLPQRIFIDEDEKPIRLNSRSAGRSGRYKISVVDWDSDGRLDVLVNSENAIWYRNAETREGKHVLKRMGNLGKRNVAGHTSSPTVCDFDKDGKPDLLVGAEDGRMYFLNHEDANTWPDIAKAARGPKEAKADHRHPAIVKTEFVFTKEPTAKCEAPVIVNTTRGLVIAWRGYGKDQSEVFTSYNDGAGWSRPIKVADGVDGRFPHMLRVDKEHALLVVAYQPTGEAMVLGASYDRGRSFRPFKSRPDSSLVHSLAHTDGPSRKEHSITEFLEWTSKTAKGDGPIATSAKFDHRLAKLILSKEGDGADLGRPEFSRINGLLHAVYTWNGKRVKHAIIDPKKLALD